MTQIESSNRIMVVTSQKRQSEGDIEVWIQVKSQEQRLKMGGKSIAERMLSTKTSSGKTLKLRGKNKNVPSAGSKER